MYVAKTTKHILQRTTIIRPTPKKPNPNFYTIIVVYHLDAVK